MIKDKIPKRQGVTQQFLPKEVTEVRAVQRMGGYWYTNWRFPFIHFKNEKLLVFTDKSILTYED